MKNHEILTKARDIVAGVIKQKTPDVRKACAEAYATLGGIVAMSKGLEPGNPVPTVFASSVSNVCDLLDAFRSGYASNDPSQTVAVETAAETKRNAERLGKAAPKWLSKEAFVDHVAKTIAKATAARPGECLRILHALHDAISKAVGNVESFAADTNAESFEETAQFTVGVEIDPMQIVPTDSTQSLAAAQVAAPAAGSNFEAAAGGGAGPVVATKTQAAGTVAGNQVADPKPDSNFEAVDKAFKSLTDTVEKSNTADDNERDIGWTMDLASEEFMSGRREIDFGRDGSKLTD